MSEALGYVGALLLIASYLTPSRYLLPLQGAACAFLLAYAISAGTLPYVIVQVACLVAIGWRLRTGRHPAGAPSRRTAAPSEDSTPK
jgi:hypothetical protein